MGLPGKQDFGRYTGAGDLLKPPGMRDSIAGFIGIIPTLARSFLNLFGIARQAPDDHNGIIPYSDAGKFYDNGQGSSTPDPLAGGWSTTLAERGMWGIFSIGFEGDMLDEARVEQGSSDFDPNLILGPEPTYPPINVAREVIKLTPSGGLSGISTQLLIPMWDSKSGRSYIGTLDYNDFNTEEASLYAFRMEDVLPGRQITVSRVQVTYRDLGPATLTAIVETAQGVIYDEKKIGTPSGDGSVKSQYFDLEITGERPQLSLFRDKNSGPVSIISAKMITDVEIAEQV